MKKWLVFILSAACLLTVPACGKPSPEDIRETISGKTYLYEKDGFGGDFTISLNDDGTFSYYEGYLSSYIGVGEWTLENDSLLLSDDDQTGFPFSNYFRVKGNDLIFQSENSTNFLYIKVADGEKFSPNSPES